MKFMFSLLIIIEWLHIQIKLIYNYFLNYSLSAEVTVSHVVGGGLRFRRDLHTCVWVEELEEVPVKTGMWALWGIMSSISRTTSVNMFVSTSDGNRDKCCGSIVECKRSVFGSKRVPMRDQNKEQQNRVYTRGLYPGKPANSLNYLYLSTVIHSKWC